MTYQAMLTLFHSMLCKDWTVGAINMNLTYSLNHAGRPLSVKLDTRCAMGKVGGKPNEENRGEALIFL